MSDSLNDDLAQFVDFTRCKSSEPRSPRPQPPGVSTDVERDEHVVTGQTDVSDPQPDAVSDPVTASLLVLLNAVVLSSNSHLDDFKRWTTTQLDQAALAIAQWQQENVPIPQAQAANAVIPWTLPNQVTNPVPFGLKTSVLATNGAFPPYDSLVKASWLQPHGRGKMHRVINALCDDWNPSEAEWYFYGIEDSFPLVHNTYCYITAAFPGIKEDYRDQPNRWQMIQIGPYGKQLLLPYNLPMKLPERPTLPTYLKDVPQLTDSDFPTLLRATRWSEAMLTMKHYVEGQVLRGHWFPSRPVRFFVMTFNFYVAMVGQIANSDELLSFQPELVLPRDNSLEHFRTGYKEKAPSVVMEYFLGYEASLREKIHQKMTGLIIDGIQGEDPAYGTREQLYGFYADNNNSWHGFDRYRALFFDSAIPIPFSGRLIFDFFACIAFSPEFSIFKHFYGVKPMQDDIPWIPDETFASGEIVIEVSASRILGIKVTLLESLRRHDQLLQQISTFRENHPEMYRTLEAMLLRIVGQNRFG